MAACADNATRDVRSPVPDAGAVPDAVDDVAWDGAVDDGGGSDGTVSDATSSDPPDDRACDAVNCGHAGACDPIVGVCACEADAWFDGVGCVERRPCDVDGSCADTCPLPVGPVFRTIAATEELVFFAPGFELEVGVSADTGSAQPDAWVAGDRLSLAAWQGHRVRVFARVVSASCRAPVFTSVYEVAASYPPAAGEPGSTAVALDDAAIEGWASVVWHVAFGDGVGPAWRDETAALGPAEGGSVDVVSLGRGGSIQVGFETPLEDRPGYDFAVFENGFSDTFLELARVSVSSDGEAWLTFDTATLHGDDVGAFGTIEPTTLGQLAGAYRQGWGTPFDLAVLRQRNEVRAGLVDLSAITHVRIEDVVGDGTEHDAFGRPMYDPYPTQDSAGFDLDAVAAMHLRAP